MKTETLRPRIFPALFAGLLIAAGTSQDAKADGLPAVRFDVPYSVACLDVTPPEFGQLHPGSKLIEARFPVSAMIRGGNANQLTHFLYHFHHVARKMEIIDYLPKTTLASDYEGGISVERVQENSKNLGVNVGGNFQGMVDGKGTAGVGQKTINTTRFSRVPPKHQLAASGTMDRGCGAFFKLEKSAHSSFEGAKEFVLIFRVPENWRADIMTATFQAAGQTKAVISSFNESRTCGFARFQIALHLAGDAEAKQIADDLSQREHTLRTTANTYNESIRERSQGSATHQLKMLFDMADPKIPSNWLDGILYQPTSRAAANRRLLPPPVRTAAEDYLTVRKQVDQLGSW
jgi:hypothetical protein